MPPAAVIARERLSDQDVLDLHMTHIGGSAIAAILGVHPFKSRLQVWLEMTGREPAQYAPSRRMQLGLALEPLVLHEFEQRTGLHVQQPNTIYVAARHPRFIATPDGIYWQSSPAQDGIYEGKVSTRIREWEEAVVVEAYCQCQWYMGILDLGQAMVCCFPNTHENLEHVLNNQWDQIPLYIETIERDEPLIETMYQEAEAFLALVAAGTPPIDATTTASDLARLYPQDTGETRELGDALRSLVESHAACARHLHAAEAAKAAVEAQLMALLGEASWGTAAGERLVSWKAHTREWLDLKRLKQDQPELAKQYTTRQTVRPLRVTHPKD